MRRVHLFVLHCSCGLTARRYSRSCLVQRGGRIHVSASACRRTSAVRAVPTLPREGSSWASTPLDALLLPARRSPPHRRSCDVATAGQPTATEVIRTQKTPGRLSTRGDCALVVRDACASATMGTILPWIDRSTVGGEGAQRLTIEHERHCLTPFPLVLVVEDHRRASRNERNRHIAARFLQRANLPSTQELSRRLARVNRETHKPSKVARSNRSHFQNNEHNVWANSGAYRRSVTGERAGTRYPGAGSVATRFLVHGRSKRSGSRFAISTAASTISHPPTASRK